MDDPEMVPLMSSTMDEWSARLPPDMRKRVQRILLALVGAVAFCIALAGCGGTRRSYGGDGGPSSGGDGGASSGDSGASSGDPFVQRNLDGLNMYRAQNGVAPLQLDDALSQFAAEGSQQLRATGVPHGHIMDAASSGAIWSSGFCNAAGENQAPSWPASSNAAELHSIDGILAQMMAEGPGGGHHDNILGAQFARVGIALLVVNGQLWLTNDFSGPCP
jgi:hypothetical protein